jgi:arylsulfatase A-like enzyme
MFADHYARTRGSRQPLNPGCGAGILHGRLPEKNAQPASTDCSEKTSMSLPNIVFILIDDLGWRDLSCYGSPFYETPNLDRLAGDGMRFTDAYAACPVCSPTRASILTGKYPAAVGVTNYINARHREYPDRGRLIDAPYIDHLPLGETSLAAVLRDGGYRTWHVGKWHLGGPDTYPDRHGFDVNVAGCGWGMPVHGYFSPWRIPTLDDGPDGEYLTDRLTDEAVRLIRENDGRPFFLNLWYYSVHIPIQAKPDKVARFEEKVRQMGLDKAKTFEEGDFFPVEHKKDKRIVRRLVQSDPDYAAMIQSLDENIGRVLAAIEEEGQADNTLIIFTSDNGGLATAEGSPTCNAPLAEGKGWMYDGGTREPLIVTWPGVVPRGSMCENPVTSPDFYPTLLGGGGLGRRPGQHSDGVSFLPLLEGAETFDRGPIFWHYPHYGNQGGTPGSSVRYGDYKLIEFFEDGRVELYNLREDVGEENDLAEADPRRATELRDMLAAWREQVQAKVPQPNPEYVPPT